MSTSKKLEEVILFQIEQTNKLARLHSQREFDRLGMDITIEQWILLKIIEESNELSQKELATKSLRDPASITRTLDILEKKAFLTRVALENNRRQYQIILTKQGKAFVKKHMKVIDVLRANSTKGISKKDLGLLSATLLKIQNNFR